MSHPPTHTRIPHKNILINCELQTHKSIERQMQKEWNKMNRIRNQLRNKQWAEASQEIILLLIIAGRQEAK